MLKKKGFWIILFALAALGAGAYSFYTNKVIPAQAQATDTPVQTAVVTTGSLVISANGVGTVIAAQEVQVGFASSGLVEAIYIEVGDDVEAGELLAQQGNTRQLELSQVSAELALANARKTLQDLYDNLDLDRANARMAVYSAQTSLADAQEARQALDYGRCNSDLVADYYDKYTRADETLQQLKDQGAAADRIDDAESNLATALANYSYCITPHTDAEKGEADAAVTVAQVALLQAETQQQALTDGPDPSAVAQAEADVAAAEYNLELANQALEGAAVTAPISGTVMAINASVGDTVNAAFITIAQLEPGKLEIFLDETDLNMIGVGYEVEVVFDALPDDTFTGHVTQVDPGLSNQGNMSVVRAEVLLDEGSYNKPQKLPTGLSASVEVIGSRAENAVLVPVEALRDLGDGQYAVFVMENGEPVLRMVEVGIMDYTYAQILSGLEAGETVTTGIVETE